jgi:tRNA threonylcarbamoyladenosine biosynthesis protein TsaB
LIERVRRAEFGCRSRQSEQLIVLALDTALNACSVAIVADSRPRAGLREQMARGQAERIAPMVREAAKEAGASLHEIDRIAVTIGPGSFTGVRVGLAFARGLALALRKPCVGLTTLEVLALEAGEEGLRGAIIDTPGALYAAVYEDGREILAPVRIERADASRVLAAACDGRPLMLRGPGASQTAGLFDNAIGVDTVSPDAKALALRALALNPELHRPNPLYLRPPLGA